MKYYNGIKRKTYFEGWYFKHQFEYESIAFIPSVSVDEKGNKSCYIQAITNTDSYIFNFPYEEFYASKSKLYIRIGKNYFSKNGCYVILSNEKVAIEAKFVYQKFTEIKGDIMGIFAFVPFMQCRHGIISMKHKVDGSLQLNDKLKIIEGGIGYIEKDSGSSFPKKYLWLQCNDFSKNLSVFISLAKIPFLKKEFDGFIASIIFNDIEYRFATYNNSKIIKSFIFDNNDKKEILLRNKRYELLISFKENSFKTLAAPNNGEMKRKVEESLNAEITVQLSKGSTIIFEQNSLNAALEYSKL